MKKFYFLFLFSAITFMSQAQWNPNTSVNLAFSTSDVSDLQSLATSDGKTWIAFYTSSGGGYQMRAQLLDVNGFPLLGSNGVLVSNQKGLTIKDGILADVAPTILRRLGISAPMEMTGTSLV